MIGMWIKFEKRQEKPSVCIYDFQNDLSDTGSFEIEKKSNNIVVKNFPKDFSDKDREKLEYLIEKMLINENYPERKMWCIG